LPRNSAESPAAFQPCLDAAYRYLSLRPRSELEVRTRLKHRGYRAPCIDQVLAELRRQGFLDDSSFARFWTENRESFSPRSRSLLRMELRRKGVPSQTISEVIQDLDDDENAYRAARKKVWRPLTTDYQVFRRSMGGFLRRRGFSYEVCQRVLNRVWHEEAGDA
jgi:regulatory protein